MRSKIVAGLLAVFLGIFSAQRFYLGRKLEWLLFLLLIPTGIPMLSGFFEGFWILTRSDEQWAEYLEALKKPRYYLDPLVARSYVYPVGIVGFLWGVSVPGLGALGLLLPLAVWLHPNRGEPLFTNRLKNVKQHQTRAIVSLVTVIMLFAFAGRDTTPEPKVRLTSATEVTQTGGIYEAVIEATPATKVLIGSVEAEKVGESTYKATMALTQPKTFFSVRAENGTAHTEAGFTVSRALTLEELAQIDEQKRLADERRLTTDKEAEEKRAAEEAMWAEKEKNMDEQQRAESEYLRDRKKVDTEILALYPDETQRKRIFAEYIRAQRAAEAETLVKYPVAAQAKESQELFSQYTTDLERAQHMGELPSVKYGTENRIKHYKQVAEKNGLTFAQLMGIVFEANTKMWDMPSK